MSKFCRHGTLAERCPICHASVEATARAPAPSRRRSASDTRPRSQISSRGGLTVRREARTDDDGYRSPLAPGLRSTQDDPTSDSWGEQNVFDVYSKSQGTGLDNTKYKDW